jgi:hypothetical protein
LFDSWSCSFARLRTLISSEVRILTWKKSPWQCLSYSRLAQKDKIWAQFLCFSVIKWSIICI